MKATVFAGSTGSEIEHVSHRGTKDLDMASYAECHKQGAAFSSTCRTPIKYKYRQPSLLPPLQLIKIEVQ